jgi:hypothetical protein
LGLLEKVPTLLRGTPGGQRGRQARPAGNLYPAKQRPEQKIDVAVALMMALGRAMAEGADEGDLEDFLRNPVIA